MIQRSFVTSTLCRIHLVLEIINITGIVERGTKAHARYNLLGGLTPQAAANEQRRERQT